MERTENSSVEIPEDFPLPSDSTPHKGLNISLWVLQIFLAAVFFITGSSEIFGAAPGVELFEKITPNPTLRYMTGAVEIVGAVVLLIPHYSGYGALQLLAATMTVAVFTHIFSIGGSPFPAMILLILLCFVAVGRRGTIAKVLWT